MSKEGETYIKNRKQMKKYIIDLTDTASFKGITIWYPYLKEGLEYAKENKISQVQIRSEEDLKRKCNFDILAQYDFIQTLHWLVPLHKQSNIEGLYCLKRLEDFRWVSFCDIPLDFTKLTTLKNLRPAIHIPCLVGRNLKILIFYSCQK